VAPTDPNLVYTSARPTRRKVRAMFVYDIRDDSSRLLHAFPEYDPRGGRHGGQHGQGRRYYAMIGTKPDKSLEAFSTTCDDKVGRAFRHGEMVGDWNQRESVGPLRGDDGRQVLRVRLADAPGARASAESSATPTSACSPTARRPSLRRRDHQLNGDRNINIANLDTGAHAIGVRIGWRTTPHVSCRNLSCPAGPRLRRRVRTRNTQPRLRSSGSSSTARRKYARRAPPQPACAAGQQRGYFAEQHAVPSRRATRSSSRATGAASRSPPTRGPPGARPSSALTGPRVQYCMRGCIVPSVAGIRCRPAMRTPIPPNGLVAHGRGAGRRARDAGRGFAGKRVLDLGGGPVQFSRRVRAPRRARHVA
jgi:hypothetical protein